MGRQVYRIDLSSSYYLRGSLRVGTGELEGKLVDISSRGTALMFLGSADPGLELETEVDLAFQMKGEGAPEFRTKAIVRSRSEVEPYVRYGFEFGDYENFDQKIPYVLRAIFNRRRAPRVEPAEPLPVQIRTDDRKEPGTLIDVSSVGMAVEIPFHLVETYAIGSHVDVAFQLPGEKKAWQARAEVRDRRLVGPVVHLGLNFDQDANGYVDVRQVLEAYVAQRSTELSTSAS